MILFIQKKRYSLTTIVIYLCLIFTPSALYPQKKNSQQISTIKAIGNTDSCHCSIRLRWSMNDPYAWKLANSYGYSIDRYTILRNGQLILTPEKSRITTVPIKPRPIKDWEAICQTDDNAAIIVQGIYGEDFEIAGSSSKLVEIVNQSNSLTQRFTFSLMAADRSFDAACMAGLGWNDSTVKRGEKYLYKIYPNIPKDKIVCDTALVFIGSDEISSLPKPIDVYATYSDQSVLLSWDIKVLKSYYSTYLIERSEDGVHFKALNQLPFSSLNDESGKESGRVFFTDTIQNNHIFSYRIKGISPFGQYGPPSDVMQGKGKTTLAFAPHINSAQIINDSTATIGWEFPEEGTVLVDHFELNRSANNADNSFTQVISYIDATQREIKYSQLLPANYFVITAVDKNGNKRNSFPYLVQPIDSIPPTVPTGLTAQIDSLGTVSLQWAANKEPDLLGYTILRSNNKTEEPAIINSKPQTENTFEEKLNLNTLNSKVYYSVLALDRRMNQSKPCQPIEVIKPDRVPPSSPVIIDSRVSANGKTTLSWINSSSDDVVSHRLYRKTEQDTVWTTVATISDLRITQFEDTLSASEGTLLLYSLWAIDRSNNISEPSPVWKVIASAKQQTGQLKNLRADMDRTNHSITISWKTNSTDIAEYTIYKAKNNEPFSTLQVIPGTHTFYTDTDLAVSNMYRYAVRATLKNGKMGEWKEVKVEY
jgi:hypothetical protein